MWVDQVKLSAHRQRFDLGGACLPQEICAEERLCRCGAQSIVTVVATDQDVVLPERIDEVLSELLVLFVAWTRTRTWPNPNSGNSTSAIFKGFFNSTKIAAFVFIVSLYITPQTTADP